MSMESEKPHIELYLFAMNQEFPAKKEHMTLLDRESKNVIDESGNVLNHERANSTTFVEPTAADSAPASWPMKVIHNKWVRNWEKIVPGRIPSDDLFPPRHPLTNLILRREDFGGIALDPETDRVFRLNHAGADLLEELIAIKKSDDTDSISSQKQKDADENGFFDFLRGAGLWVE